MGKNCSGFRLRWKEFLKCPFTFISWGKRPNCSMSFVFWTLAEHPRLDIVYCSARLQPGLRCSTGEEAVALPVFPNVPLAVMS